MIILGVDFGEARTGLAICDRSELLASPVGTIAETDFDTCVEKVAAAAKERRAACIVVGYPKNMNGTIGPRAEKVTLLANMIKERIKFRLSYDLPNQSELFSQPNVFETYNKDELNQAISIAKAKGYKLIKLEQYRQFVYVDDK